VDNHLLDLTIVIPVKNEESNLTGCLQSIGKDFAKRIVIIDSGSTDRTREIAEQFGSHVINFSWNGEFPKKRNWYLINYTPDSQWVLFLDADEYLTTNFKNFLRKELPISPYVGYWLYYTIYFLGKELKGGYPLAKLALFKVGSGLYERIDEKMWSHLDMEIHEHPILNGEVSEIRHKIDHQDFRGVSHYIKKHDEYSSWEAARYMAMRSDLELLRTFTWKQKIKYRFISTPLLGPFFFLGSFLFMGGFKDGSRGFAFAILKASYFIQIYCKIKEMKIIKQ